LHDGGLHDAGGLFGSIVGTQLSPAVGGQHTLPVKLQPSGQHPLFSPPTGLYPGNPPQSPRFGSCVVLVGVDVVDVLGSGVVVLLFGSPVPVVLLLVEVEG